MNDFDLDPTDLDLLSEVVDTDLDLDVDESEESDDFDADYAAVDDRWDGSGVPSWSAWA